MHLSSHELLYVKKIIMLHAPSLFFSEMDYCTRLNKLYVRKKQGVISELKRQKDKQVIIQKSGLAVTLFCREAVSSDFIFDLNISAYFRRPILHEISYLLTLDKKLQFLVNVFRQMNIIKISVSIKQISNC